MHKVLFPLLFLLPLTASACGFGIMGEDYRIALFNPYLIGKEYAPFFYSSNTFHSGTNAKAGRDRQRNVELWARHLGKGVRPDDVMEIMYNTSYEQWTEAAAEQPDSLFQANPVWAAVRNQPQLLEYLLYAKAYERPSSFNLTWWYGQAEDEGNTAKPDADALLRTAEQAYAQAPDGSFLQQRWAYQLLLQAFYRTDLPTFDALFAKHFRVDTSILGDWARFQRTNLHREEPRAIIHYANAFRILPEKAPAAYQRTSDLIDVAAALHLASNDAERSNLYALAAVKNPGRALDALRNAYRADPDNPLLDLLVVREINKLEDWLMNYELTSHPASMTGHWVNMNGDGFDYYSAKPSEMEAVRAANRAHDEQYLNELRAFLDDFESPEGKAMSGLYRAHTALLAGNYSAARKHATKVGQATEEQRTQARMIIVLSLLQDDGVTLAEKRQELSEWLLPLEMAIEPDFGLEPEDMYGHWNHPTQSNRRAAISRVGAQVFEAAGDTVSAFFLFNRSLPMPYGNDYTSMYYSTIDYLDREISPEVFNGILALMTNEPKNDYHKMLVEGARTQVESVWDVAGTVALRNGDLDQASIYFNAIDPEWYDSTYAFKEHLKRSPFTEPFNPAEPFPGKAAVVDAMRTYQQVANSGGPGADEACYKLALAWYNMSYLGNSWMMTTYGHSRYDFPDEVTEWPLTIGGAALPHSSSVLQNVTQAGNAFDYLDCVEALSNKLELLAKASYLRGLIDFRRHEARIFSDWTIRNTKHVLDSARREAFSSWKNAHLDTDYYETVVSNCDRIREM